MSSHSAGVRAALVLAVLGLSLLGSAAPAAAHATLVRTQPAANARLSDEPRQILLSFDEPVNLALGHVVVIGPDGARLSTGYTMHEGGRTVSVALRPGQGNGTYVVSYRVISLDTHPVSGGYFFQVGHGSAAAAARSAAGGSLPTTAASAGAPENTTVRAVYAACRYAGFLGLLLLLGGAVFLVALWPAGVPGRRARRLVMAGYGLVVAATMGELVLQTPYAAGTTLGGITGTDFDAVVATRFGTAHLVRLALLALAAPVLVGLSARPPAGGDGPRGGRPRWPMLSAAPIAVGLLVTWAYSGHAGTTAPAVSVPSDVVHLAAMAVWIGGLVVLAVALLPTARAADLRVTLPRWSRLAMLSVVALIVSGSVQAVLEVGGWSGLTNTTYGQLLLAKIGLLFVVLVVAAFSRRWVLRNFVLRAPTAQEVTLPGPAVTPGPSRVELVRLRRGVAVESVLGAAAVAVAAMLIQAAPGRSVPGPSPSSAGTTHPITRHGPYRATVRNGNVVLHVKVDPAVAGVQYIYLGAHRPDGSRLHVRQWTLSVSNARLGLDQVKVPVLTDVGIGHHYIYGSFTMPTGGEWTVQVTARTSDVDETVVTRRLRVRS